ncbi:MAG TPA: thioesterase domain-containing protein, partial [Conexibacter sp.]|nr:thioesterase domain-containing protein [Conexibacter sp.]
QAAAGDEPFALVGYSGGGIVAHAVAHALERAGAEVAGLVLLDTFAADDAVTPRLISSVIGELVRQPAGASLVDDDQLAAAGAYIRLFRSWRPAPLRTPSLLLRAAEPLPQLADARPAPAGALADAERVVPGSHFSMVARNAGTTAAAIDRWLAERTAEAAA